MRNKQKLFYWTVCAGLVTAVLQACDTERSPCLEPVATYVNMKCYQHIDSNNTYIDSLLPNVNIGSVDIDSARFWVSGLKKTGSFPVILSPLHDTTRWVLQPDSAVTAWDTLTFIYERRLKFLSNACGYTYTYLLQQVTATKYNIDSVAIGNADVTTKAGVEHVKIFL